MKLQIVLALLIFSSFIANAQQVKYYSEINFLDSGKVAMYKGEMYTGEIIDTNSKGIKVYDGWFKNGLLDGTSTYWRDNGKKQSEVNFKDGTLNGNWTIFQEGGKRDVFVYVNGANTEARVYSAAGLPDSIWAYYSPDGNTLLRTESYSNGVKEGAWTTYDSNGNTNTTWYHNGVEDKNAGYVVSNYAFSSPNSYLLEIPVSSKSRKYSEFVIGSATHPGASHQDVQSFISKIYDCFIKYRDTKFIKSPDFGSYSADTVSFRVKLTNINVSITTQNTGPYSVAYTANLDADLITTDLHNNSSTTFHIHSNSPDVGYSGNSARLSLRSALDKDILNTTVVDYINTAFPLRATLTQIIKYSSDSSAVKIILNGGSKDYIEEGMRFVLSGPALPGNIQPAIEIKATDVDADRCTCKVISGGRKITDMMKKGVPLVFILESKD